MLDLQKYFTLEELHPTLLFSQEKGLSSGRPPSGILLRKTTFGILSGKGTFLVLQKVFFSENLHPEFV